ncbi:DEAD/DEAH box helicase [Pandoraea apista]|uniref:ATP-dependent RNA helicase RhlE n=1 Tax=Pandoraea apista TaxID=93218 RepID=A0A5E5NY86_9BURK|nr:DEAD/DEAH box helicase [Pandoraea apista]AJE98094.1 RNA helicase [Pandoraea apista]AKH72101.1 RNA helicase [Pandoraea apista]AKI60532.1 RNA helicase [Pandoraea apista]OXS94765.1 RNA helicase [Pandoraea apista]VVG69080.1 DEAD/DEAH box helicase [Pandoraea apista]
MSFETLGLSADILRAVADLGYTHPTPIQLQAIPAVLQGGDLLAGAQTGTGKTAGFTLPILQMLASRARPAAANGKRPVRALVLTPTRELAAQVEESVTQYGKYLRLTSMTVFGGVSMVPQVKQLARGVDILVATPGRLLDHMQQKTVDLSGVEILVLDEADRMLDMGFIRDIRRVLAVLPAKRQNLLFSATFSDEIKQLADGLLKSPALIEVARRNTTAETIAQKIHPVDRDRKRELLEHLVREHNWFQVLVFTRTKHGANRLAEQLTKGGIPALAIHGNKSQGARTRALAEFKSGTLQVLVATDIAARGIDIDQLPHVVNFDLPEVAEDYVHRIGRTGRAGANGEAVSLVCVDEHQLLTQIERLIKRTIDREVIPGFEPDPHAVAQPIRKAQQGRGAGGGRGGRSGGDDARQPARAPREAREPKPRREGERGGRQGGNGGKAGTGVNAGNAGNAGHGGQQRQQAPKRQADAQRAPARAAQPSGAPRQGQGQDGRSSQSAPRGQGGGGERGDFAQRGPRPARRDGAGGALLMGKPKRD